MTLANKDRYIAMIAALFAFGLATLANAQTMPNSIAGVGYLQIDGLATVGASSVSVPATLTVTLQPYPYNTATAAFVNDSAGTCYQYANQFATNRSLVYCPAGTTGVTPAGIVAPTETYTLQVATSTKIVLNDGSATNMATIAPGDTLNVFGYYEGGMVIDATTIRNLSKPASWTYAYIYPNSGAALTTAAGTEVSADLSAATIATIEAKIQAISNQIANIKARILSGNY